MSKTAHSLPSSPTWRAFLSSITFERWLLTWLSILLCHSFLYAVHFHLSQVVALDAQYRITTESFLLPVFSSLLVLVISSLVWQRQASLLRWSEAMIALHSTFALILLVLSQGRYFIVPWGQILGLVNEIRGFESGQDIMSDISALFQAMTDAILIAYSLALAVSMILSRARKPLLAALQSLSMSGLLLGLFLTMNSTQSATIRLPQQDGKPDVEFAWESLTDGCVEYRFAAEGVRAIWLGEEGLASIEPMNYSSYCDGTPRLLRVVTNEDREHRYLVGKLTWSNLDAWRQALAAALLLPLFFLYAETWLLRLQVVYTDETPLDLQESR